MQSNKNRCLATVNDPYSFTIVEKIHKKRKGLNYKSICINVDTSKYTSQKQTVDGVVYRYVQYDKNTRIVTHHNEHRIFTPYPTDGRNDNVFANWIREENYLNKYAMEYINEHHVKELTQTINNRIMEHLFG